jgi:hypothetical protein
VLPLSLRYTDAPSGDRMFAVRASARGGAAYL